MRPLLDLLARLLARAVLRVFYRRVEVVGLERIPARGPLVFVANHGNSLIDPILMLAFLPRMPRFLAKSTLWSNPAVRPLLALGGAVPVYRRQDAGEDTARNRDTFARCHAELASGGCVALFPEGISHDEPAVQPLRTGAARIVLEGETRDVRIVPTGLDFEDKQRFRSRVLLVVGEPLDPAEQIALHRRDERAAVRALTERIGHALRAVTPNHASWTEARLVARAADVLEARDVELPRRAALAERFRARQALATAWARFAAQHPERAATLSQRLARYDALLARTGLRDEHLSATYAPAAVLWHLAVRLPLLALWLPAALIGTLLNAVPYRAAGLVAGRFASKPDLPATYKLLVGLFGLPLWWAVLGVGVALAAGPVAGVGIALLAPATGLAALRFHEEHGRLVAESRAWLALHSRRALMLRVRRRRLRRELAAARAVVDAAEAQPQRTPVPPTPQ